MALHLPAHTLADEARSPILGVSFNSSGSSSFATATTEGWVVYRTDPLEVLSRREFPNGSLRIVLPLEQSNLLFLVGGPPSPLYPPNKVLFWDDKIGRTVAELEFREDVRGLAARRDRLVVVLRRRVIVFVLGKGGVGVWREGYYETTPNPTGLVALATEEGSSLLAFPGRQAGQVQLVRLPPLDSSIPPLPPAPSHDPSTTPFPSVSIILAHTTPLSALSTTPSGSMLATASSKGTLVRVWDAQSSHLIKELRRGTDSAEIFGIAFRKDGGALCVSSDKGTVHVWDLTTTRDEKRKAEAESESPRQKQFDILKPYLPKYFSSEWSHSQFRLPPPAPPTSRLPFSLSNPSEPGRAATPTIEDDICICAWIEVERPPPPPSAVPGPSPTMQRTDSRESRKGKERERTDSAVGGTGGGKENLRRQYQQQQRRSSSSYTPPPPPPMPTVESQIVAVTHSGGWFRISLGAQPEGAAIPSVVGLGKDSTSDCRLEEYRRFGNKDGW